VAVSRTLRLNLLAAVSARAEIRRVLYHANEDFHLFLNRGSFRQISLLTTVGGLQGESMKRRAFLKSTAAVTSGLLTGLHKAAAQSGPVAGPQPNILFIL
jgi:hypothetical protein